jgi:hypothetical protein
MAKSSISRFPNDVRAYDHFLRDDTAYQVLLTLANTPSHSKDDNAVIQALLFLFLRNKNFNNRYFQVSMESLFQSKHFDPKTVNSVLHKFIMNSQRSTGNTSCDLQLNNHPYDYKFSMDDKVLLARNVIVPIQVYHENAINRFIFLWLKHMDNISEINNSLNTDSLLYYKNLFEKVKTIDENKSLNVKEKLLAINKITFKDLDSRPSDCFIPIVLPVGDPSHVPNILVSEKLNLPPTKDTISNVLDKRYNFIITTLEQQSREYLYLRTNGVFGSSPSSLDEFDSISSS